MRDAKPAAIPNTSGLEPHTVADKARWDEPLPTDQATMFRQIVGKLHHEYHRELSQKRASRSREQGVGSRELGVGSREWEQGGGRREE